MVSLHLCVYLRSVRTRNLDSQIQRDQSRFVQIAGQKNQVNGRPDGGRFCIVIALIALATNVTAVETNDPETLSYLPYLNGRPWPQIPTTKYIETTSNLWVHPTSPKKYPTVQEVADDGADFTTVIIRLPDGTVYKTYNAMVLGPYLSAVYMGDFNRDGVPDFMAIKPGSGCGLAGEYCIGVFAFSERKDYRFTRSWTMDLGPENLIVDPKTKGFRFIHTSFRSAMGPDGRYHSFWVHRFFKWEYDRFDKDPNLPPIWIQFLYRSNHNPTKMLTPEVKAKAWAEDPESQARIDW